MKNSNRLIPAILALLIFILYFSSLPMTLTEGDSGEWTLIAKYGGIPHPSGYPLYASFIRAVVWMLPGLPVVTDLALFSAVCAVSAAIVTYNALLKLKPEPMASAFSVIVVFTTAVVWRMANIPEPFALNILLAACVFYVFTRALREDFARPNTPFFVMGLLFGLGFCNHQTLVWLLPMPAVLLLTTGRTAMLQRFGVAVLGLVIGLLPLTYFLFAQSDHSPYDFFSVQTPMELLHLLLRSGYGSFALAPHQTPSNWQSVVYFWTKLWPWFSGVFLIIIPIGVLSLANECNDADVGNRKIARLLTLGWSVSLSGSALVFLRLFNVNITGMIPSIIERFMAMSVWLMVLPLFYGCLKIAAFLRMRGYPIKGLVIFGSCLLVGHLCYQFQRADRSTAFLYEDHIKTVYKISKLLDDAPIISASDAEDYGLMYGQFVLGLASEKTRYLNLGFWGSKPYMRRINQLMHWNPEESASWGRGALVTRVLNERKQVFVVDVPEDPKPKLFDHSYLVGSGVVLVSSERSLPSPDEIMALNEDLWKNVIVLPKTCKEVQFLSAWDYDLYLKYVHNLEALSRQFETAKRSDLVVRVNKILDRVCRDSASL